MMKKLILMMLLVVGGVSTMNAWDNLYLLCDANNWTQNNSYQFTRVDNDNFYYILDANSLKNSDFIFRIKDTANDWGAWQNEAIIGTTEYAGKKGEIGMGYKVPANSETKFVYIWATYKEYAKDDWRWYLTCTIITETTIVAFVDIDENWNADTKAYAWLNNGIKLLGDWPGTSMNVSNNIHTLEIPYSPNAKIKFTDNYNGGNESSEFDLEKNKVYKYNEKVEQVSANISKVGYATFSSAYPVDFTNVTGVTAYRATQTSDKKVLLKKIDGQVPAATGLLLKGSSGTVTIPTCVTTTSIGDNKLKASVKDITLVYADLAGVYRYFLAGSDQSSVGFYFLANNQTSGAGKAYYETDVALAEEGNSARASWIFEDDETTGISIVKNSVKSTDVYNLNGQRVNNAVRGLYIVNGKKVIMK